MFFFQLFFRDEILFEKETTMNEAKVIDSIEGLYKIISFKIFRKTPGVTFDLVPLHLFPNVDSIDRVLHQQNAQSPGKINEVERPWYMHSHQAENLIVLHGVRQVELYSKHYGKIEKFEVAPNYIKKDGQVVLEGGGMLIWPTNVFHRIITGKEGSASLNFATHFDGFDLKTNFNIYDVNIETGDYKVIREGFKDQ